MACGRAARAAPPGPHLAFDDSPPNAVGNRMKKGRENAEIRMRTVSKLIVMAAVVALPAVVLHFTTRDESRPVATGAPPADASACVAVAGPSPLPTALLETSGIARTADGSLWTHNDGAEARLHRLDEAGWVVQVVRVDGVRALDIEDIDAGPCPDGAGECLWLADIGDNDGERAGVALLIVPLPDAAASSARATRIAFSYSDGPRDAEALAVLPDGSAVVVTKGRGTPIDAYRLTLDGRGRADVAHLARVAARAPQSRQRITGGGASEDGRWIALRSNDHLSLHRTERLLAGDVSPALEYDLRPLREAQGEGVDLASDGSVWLTSEGERGTPTLARLRCTLPE